MTSSPHRTLDLRPPAPGIFVCVVVVAVLPIFPASPGGDPLGFAPRAADAQTANDAQLAARIMTVLLNHPTLGDQPIEVDVRAGVATLSGRVRSADDAQQAVELVRALSGLQDVQSTLQVGGVETFAGPPDSVRFGGPIERPTGPTRGRVGIGVGLGYANSTDDDLGNTTLVGPIFRLAPKAGWGPTLALGWFTTDLKRGPGGEPGLARLSVKPILGGMAYTVLRGRLSTSFSLTGGYVFNGLDVDTDRVDVNRAIDVGNSLAGRAGVSVWYELTRRIGINVSGGYVATRPEVTFISGDVIRKATVRADATVVGAGLTFWIF